VPHSSALCLSEAVVPYCEVRANKQQIGVLFPPMVKSTFVDFNVHESIYSQRLVTLTTAMAPDFFNHLAKVRFVFIHSVP
jgi:hypothetical protein